MQRSYKQLKFYDRKKDLKGPGIEDLAMPAVENENSSMKLPNINKKPGFKKIRMKLGMK